MHTNCELETDGLIFWQKGKNPGTSKIGQVYVMSFGLNNNGSQKEDPERIANAERFCKAWNNYDELIEVVKLLTSKCYNPIELSERYNKGKELLKKLKE